MAHNPSEQGALPDPHERLVAARAAAVRRFRANGAGTDPSALVTAINEMNDEVLGATNPDTRPGPASWQIEEARNGRR